MSQQASRAVLKHTESKVLNLECLFVRRYSPFGGFRQVADAVQAVVTGFAPQLAGAGMHYACLCATAPSKDSAFSDCAGLSEARWYCAFAVGCVSPRVLSPRLGPPYGALLPLDVVALPPTTQRYMMMSVARRA